jgi:UDP-N-acetylglucosamine 2-epimerase (non-hydrolysing)
MKRIKVLTVVGTRPEIIKLSRVIVELREHVHLVLAHTGQNYDYELSEIFFKDLGIPKPDHFMNIAGKTLAESIGNIISRSDAVMEKERPDAVLLLGDTNSCLSVIAAKRRKIPIFHMEAGNRCFDLRVPEEINRKIVDHTSDINMPFSEHARRYLLAEGIRPETIIKTGSPLPEVLQFHHSQIQNARALESLQLTRRDYFVVSSHREENVDSPDRLRSLLNALNALAREYDRPIIFSCHPRTQKRRAALKGAGRVDRRVRFLKPLGFFDYCSLQQNASCVISDSGTLTEEASILNFPAVTIRETHERPEGMDQGTLIMCGLQTDSVLNAIRVVMKQFGGGQRVFQTPPDYGPVNVSKKVVRIILSYIDYVNRTVWHK